MRDVMRMIRGAVVAGFCMISGFAQAQDAFFEDLPTSDLVEMHAVIGKELARRGVYPEVYDPTAEYALWLFRAAFGLWVDKDGEIDAVDRDGKRYVITGVRLGSGFPKLPKLKDMEFDYLGVVLFTQDHRIQRAGLVSRAALAPMLAQDAVVSAGPDSPFWRLEALEDVTPQIYMEATNFDFTNDG